MNSPSLTLYFSFLSLLYFEIIPMAFLVSKRV